MVKTTATANEEQTQAQKILNFDLQRFADAENGGSDAADSGANADVGIDNVAEQEEKEKDSRIAELEKQLAEADKKYGKLKGTLDSKLKELGDMTKKERERMTAEELERKEIEEIKAQNELLLKEREIVSAERRFIQSGCGTELAGQGAKALIEQDFDTLFDVIDKLVAGKIASEKTELLKAMPKPQGGGSSVGMTKEQFDRLGYKQRVELLNKDPETYNKYANK